MNSLVRFGSIASALGALLVPAVASAHPTYAHGSYGRGWSAPRYTVAPRYAPRYVAPPRYYAPPQPYYAPRVYVAPRAWEHHERWVAPVRGGWRR